MTTTIIDAQMEHEEQIQTAIAHDDYVTLFKISQEVEDDEYAYELRQYAERARANCWAHDEKNDNTL